jgi:hypothetical protein
LDTQRILSELKSQRELLDRAILVLEQADGARGAKTVGESNLRVGTPANPRATKGRGRHLTTAGRKRLSALMKKRWAERKKKGRKSL